MQACEMQACEMKANVKVNSERHDWLDRFMLDKESQGVVDFLCSVKSVDPRKYQKNTLNLLQPGTGQWFIESDEFKFWFETPKSKLGHALGHVGEGNAVAYFYCDYKDSETHKLVNILGSVAQQLAARDEHTFAKAKALYAQHHPEGKPSSQATPEELRDLIVDISKSLDNTLIIVDGLDECADTRLVVDLLKGLSDSAETNISFSPVAMSVSYGNGFNMTM